MELFHLRRRYDPWALSSRVQTVTENIQWSQFNSMDLLVEHNFIYWLNCQLHIANERTAAASHKWTFRPANRSQNIKDNFHYINLDS